MTKNILFIHGWGYDQLFWDQHILQYNNDYQFLFYNRGYYGKFQKPVINPNGKNCCVTHSSGLFFAFQEYDMTVFDKLIIYAGFEKFPDIKGLKAMRLGMRHNPNKILCDFHQACGYMPNHIKQPNYELLKSDLNMLETYNLYENKVWKQQLYTAYHGDNDIILKEISLENAKILPNAGHLCNLI